MRLIFAYACSYACAYACIYSETNNFINTYMHPHLDGMQEKNQLESSLDIKRPLVIRALRRSNVRKKIAEYLFEISPSSSYTSEIAYNIKTTPTNVIGAIRGMGTRYKEEESLLSLDIVEEKSGGKNIRLYGLTTYGKHVLETFRDYR